MVNNPSLIGCITIDSDGQHTIKDMLKCIKVFLKNKKCLVLGCRDFSGDDIPFKSKFGNNLTRKVFRLCCGLIISDTQTGLRVIPREFMKDLLSIEGERFEFETNMLINSKGKYDIKEVKIQTIYDSKENHSTHFNPLNDSIKIYKLIFKGFLKYAFSSITSFLIDVVIFSIFISILKDKLPNGYIIVSTIIARVFSSLYNFTMNHIFVFKSNEKIKKTFIRYYILAIVQMLCSGLCVTMVNRVLTFGETISKIIVDTILFIISFFIKKGLYSRRKTIK